MANDNETVDQVCESVEYLFGTDGGGLEIFGEHINPISLADRILAAHNREMNALAKQKAAEAHEVFVKNAELANAIVMKGNEIASLRLLVGELADALECAICGLSNKVVTYGETYRLVAKAREVVK